MPSDGRYMYPHPPPNMPYDYGAYPANTYDNSQYPPSQSGATQRPPHPVNANPSVFHVYPRSFMTHSQPTYQPQYGPPPHYVMAHQQQWEATWPPYSAPMPYPLASGQPPPEPVVHRPEAPPVETTRQEPQQPVAQPPKPPEAELPPPQTQAHVNGNLNGSASQEKQKPYMNGNTHGAQLPEEFNFLKVWRCRRVV